MSKIIAVIGATGNQGGSVANTFLEDPEWRVRAITRNPASPKAQALASRGAEVVAADMDDKASLARAFAGVHAVYLVSDPISILSAGPDKAAVKPAEGQNLFDWATACEVAQLKNAVDAAAGTASLERLVLSVLPDVKGLSGGKYAHVYHFDSKAKGEAYVRETYPELWAKTSSYVAGNFLSNYLPGGMNPATKVSSIARCRVLTERRMLTVTCRRRTAPCSSIPASRPTRRSPSLPPRRTLAPLSRRSCASRQPAKRSSASASP